jgi:hypothetical protein
MSPIDAAKLVLVLIVSGSTSACGVRSLDTESVRAFVDLADNAARKRFAPEICALRARDFRMHQTFYASGMPQPAKLTLDKALYCKSAGDFSKLQQYELERKSIKIEIAADRKTARVEARYIEKKPFYGDYQPAFADDYTDVEVLDSTDWSNIGIEDGDIVFRETRAEIRQTLVPRTELHLPYTK